MGKDLSVILCTWNNSARLRITLDAISGCFVPEGIDWELVVVNNNSTDDTEHVVGGFQGRLPITYVFEPKQGLSNARNAGLAAASGRFVLFTDDDVKPYPQWLRAFWKAFQDKPEGYYFGGPIESEFEDPKVPIDILPFAPYSVKGLNWGSEDKVLTKGEPFVSANWGCQRRLIEDVGGFNPGLGLNPLSNGVLTGEESDLMRKLKILGIVPWYVSDAGIVHYVPIDKCNVIHISHRQESNQRYKSMIKKYKGQISFRDIVYVYVGVVFKWTKYIGSKLLNRKWQFRYVEWKRELGRLRGMMMSRAEISRIIGISDNGV